MENLLRIKRFLSHRVYEWELNKGDHLYVRTGCFASNHHGIYMGDNLLINVTSARGHTSCPYNTTGCQLGLPDNALLSKTCMRCFRDGRPLRRYRYGVGAIEHMLKVPGTCTTAHSLPPKEVTERADVMINNGIKPYRVPKNSYEDFALYCKTSRMVPHSELFTGTSNQAKGLYALYLALVAGTGAAGLAYFIAPYAFEHIRKAGCSYILGTIGQRYRLLRVASMSFAAVSALTYFSARHNYDIGVRSDAVAESSEDLIKRLVSKNQSMNRAPET